MARPAGGVRWTGSDTILGPLLDDDDPRSERFELLAEHRAEQLDVAEVLEGAEARAVGRLADGGDHRVAVDLGDLALDGHGAAAARSIRLAQLVAHEPHAADVAVLIPQDLDRADEELHVHALALGLAQLNRLDNIVARRRELAAIYRELLPSELDVQQTPEGAESNYQTFGVVLPLGIVVLIAYGLFRLFGRPRRDPDPPLDATG